MVGKHELDRFDDDPPADPFGAVTVVFIGGPKDGEMEAVRSGSQMYLLEGLLAFSWEGPDHVERRCTHRYDRDGYSMIYRGYEETTMDQQKIASADLQTSNAAEEVTPAAPDTQVDVNVNVPTPAAPEQPAEPASEPAPATGDSPAPTPEEARPAVDEAVPGTLDQRNEGDTTSGETSQD